MIALADARSTTPHLQSSRVLLSGSGRIRCSAFDVVTKNLISLGALAIEELATSPKADIEGFDIPFTSSRLEVPSGLSLQSQVVEEHENVVDTKPAPVNHSLLTEEKGKSIAASSSMQFVAQLHQACQQAFGNHESLNFEFIEEGGPDCKQCILTIKRPNGLSRSYASEANFKRKSDAKARAAAIAVDMGAIDFILTGNKDGSKSQLLLAPIDGKLKNEDTTMDEGKDDEKTTEIETCCIEWRAGQVHPRWVFFSEHKGSPYHGCVLVIELSAHLQRAYSVSPIYETKAEAKAQCSLLAIKQGAIDFIKFGNGQTAPTQATDEMLGQATAKEDASPPDNKGRAGTVLLQSFFDTLPKPFPEPIGDRPISEINAPGMLNNTLQLAKGAKLSIQYYFLSDSGLHGCILRLIRPEETRTYMVDPKFAKRPDAKAAVCLLAISQGVNQYIRDIAASIENKITMEMRKTANEQILPILGSEYAKLRQGMHPTYEYDHDNGAFGCTLVLTVPSKSAESDSEGDTKRWSVTAEYRTKQDAKIAVVYKAGGEAIEFVRFRGQPPPPDHDPFKPYKRPKDGPQASDYGKKTDGKGDVKREERSPSLDSPVPPVDRAPPRRQSSTSGQVRLGLSDEKEDAHQRGDSSRRLKRISQVKPRQGPYPNAPMPSYGAPTNVYTTTHPYDVSAAASAVIDRITGASKPPYPHPPQPSSSHHQPQPPPEPIPKAHMHSLQPPSTFTPPPHPYAANHYPPPPYPSDARAFPTMQPHYPPPPPNVYQLPAPAPPHLPSAYGSTPSPYPPPPPPHAAFYPDPRVQYYLTPSSYHPPPVHPGTPYAYPHPPPTRAPYPSDAGEFTPRPPQAHTPPEPNPRCAHGNSPPYRATSFSNPKDRQKRPRSRERTPNETQIMKKQRSESSLSTERSSRSREPPGLADRKESPGPPRARSRTHGPSNPSAITALYEYCADEHIPRPEFSHKIVSDNGKDMLKVWVILGKERLELPTLFHSVNEGKQRLAKQVLQRLISQSRSGDQDYS